jgi:hypothetical protein
VSRPALGPTQPPVQWVPVVLYPGLKRSRGVTLTTHQHLVPRSKMSRSYTSSPPKSLRGVKQLHHKIFSTGTWSDKALLSNLLEGYLLVRNIFCHNPCLRLPLPLSFPSSDPTQAFRFRASTFQPEDAGSKFLRNVHIDIETTQSHNHKCGARRIEQHLVNISQIKHNPNPLNCLIYKNADGQRKTWPPHY